MNLGELKSEGYRSTDQYEVLVSQSDSWHRHCNVCAKSHIGDFVTITYGLGSSRTLVALCPECAKEMAEKLMNALDSQRIVR